MRRYFSLVDLINRTVKWLLAVMIAVMSAIVIIQVFCRLTYIQVPWSEELARYLMIYITFIGTGYAVRYDLMMSVAMVVNKLSPSRYRVVSIASNTIMLIFFGIIFYFGIRLSQRVQFQRSPAMQLSMAYPYAGILAGSALMMLNAATVIMERIAGRGMKK